MRFSLSTGLRARDLRGAITYVNPAFCEMSGYSADELIGVNFRDFVHPEDVETAKAEFDALMERYHGLAIDLRSATRETLSRVTSAYARARQYERVILPAQRRVVEETQLQYNAMQLGIFQLLQARREQLDVELAYVDTLREFWSSAAAIDTLLAGHRVDVGEDTGATTMSAGSEPAGGH